MIKIGEQINIHLILMSNVFTGGLKGEAPKTFSLGLQQRDIFLLMNKKTLHTWHKSIGIRFHVVTASRSNTSKLSDQIWRMIFFSVTFSLFNLKHLIIN
jgi:hypothetical protein